MGVCGLDCDMSSKPTLGRDKTICVGNCGSDRCKACKHIVEGNNFTSNVTKNKYLVSSPVHGRSFKVAVMLISCGRYGIQCVGKTAPILSSRLNHYWNRLKQLLD